VRPLDIVFLGLSITSSWGNGHATTYRALLRALAERGHRVRFLERDVPWYAQNRDLPKPPFCRTELYGSLRDLRAHHSRVIGSADLVVLGSYVPEGIAVARWLLSVARHHTAFYDIDTPATLTALEAGRCEYLERALIPEFDLYLSFTGGPTLRRLETQFRARRAHPLYCSFDEHTYFPEAHSLRWLLGYMGTYSADRQPGLQELMIAPAEQRPNDAFAVAGPLYPDHIVWPANVQRYFHLSPAEHRSFYCAQRFTLNLTRADMRAVGHSPSVRLFEAAACGTPIISDPWPGLDEFFTPGIEIFVASSREEMLKILSTISPAQARAVGQRARQRVLNSHTARHRALSLERYVAALDEREHEDTITGRVQTRT
jgi:spore maturation protein CgeB